MTSARWVDGITWFAGVIDQESTRETRNRLNEAYVLQWTNTGQYEEVEEKDVDDFQLPFIAPLCQARGCLIL